jgi:hypothetical protein
LSVPVLDDDGVVSIIQLRRLYVDTFAIATNAVDTNSFELTNRDAYDLAVATLLGSLPALIEFVEAHLVLHAVTHAKADEAPAVRRVLQSMTKVRL